MRILLVAGTLPPNVCGVGDYTARLAEALAADGQHQVSVLTSAADVEVSDHVDHITGATNWKFGDLKSVAQAIASSAADVVHLQMPGQGFRHSRLPDLVPAMSWRAGKAVVRTWHEPPGLRALLPLAVQAIAPGETIVVRKDFLRRLPAVMRRVLHHRCTYIPGASAIPQIRMSAERRRVFQQSYKRREGRLIVFFGFIYPAKGAEHVFDIADATRDTLIFVGPVDLEDNYTRKVLARCHENGWDGHARSLGALPPREVAELLAAADAVLLPFAAGGGNWNSSISAAVQQGTPVVTTSATKLGLDRAAMVDYSRPNDIEGMRGALDRLASQLRTPSPRLDRNEWQIIARRHLSVYRRAMARRGLL